MQQQLFNETLTDALTDLVNQLGGAKKVGKELWPEKMVREAGNQLLNCLNPEHAQKLSLEQIDLILSMAKQKNCHTIAKYIGDRYGYKFIPIKPEDEKAELYHAFIKATEDMQVITKRMEKLNGGASK